jgi:hypothetical protein
MDNFIYAHIVKRNNMVDFSKGTLLSCPNARGYWELVDIQNGADSQWNVIYNEQWPFPGAGGWIATNGVRTVMCSSLKGKWRKISDMFQPGEDISNSDVYKNARIKKGL